jgi:hypothetical protein
MVKSIVKLMFLAVVCVAVSGCSDGQPKPILARVPNHIFVRAPSNVAVTHLQNAFQKCDNAYYINTLQSNEGVYMDIMFNLGINGPVEVNELLIKTEPGGSLLVARSGRWTQLTLNLLRNWAENGAICQPN